MSSKVQASLLHICLILVNFSPLSSRICIFLGCLPFTLLTTFHTFASGVRLAILLVISLQLFFLCSTTIFRCSALNFFHLKKFCGDFLLQYALYALSFYLSDAVNSPFHQGFGKNGITVYSTVASFILVVSLL